MNQSTHFEDTLIALKREARDGSGNRVKLETWVGVPTVGQLREATFNFLSNFDVGAMYITRDPTGKLIESREAEAAAWDNLALLAHATAAALREVP